MHWALSLSLDELGRFDTYFQDVTPQILERVQQRVQVSDKAQSDGALAEYMQAY